jgi:bifunctional ADP-heptose synthase (sugar kinase/adenylyltransferase)
MNIIVLGDIMLDINHICETTRKAPEAPIPIYNIIKTNYILGGAGNVAKNLNRLQTNVEIISVIGDDLYGKKIQEMLDSSNIKNKC